MSSFAGVIVVVDQPVDLAVELVESVPGMSFAIEAVVISEVHGCHIGWMDFSCSGHGQDEVLLVLLQVLRFVQDWLPLGWENVAGVVGNPGRDTSHVYNWDSVNHVVVMDVPDVVSVHFPEIRPEPIKPLPVMVESFPSCVG